MEQRVLLAASLATYVLPEHYLFKSGKTLTVPSDGKPIDIALNYLTQHAGDLGLSADDVASPIITDQYTDLDSGTTHIYLEQRVNGTSVDNTSLNINLTRDGRIISIGGAFVSKVKTKLAALPKKATIAVRQSLQGLKGLGLKVPIDSVLASGAVEGGVAFKVPTISLDPIRPQFHYVATPGGIAPVYQMVVRTPDGQHWYNSYVNAGDGTMLYANDWVDHATYNVYPQPTESPNDAPSGTATRSILTDPYDPTASPFGWHDTNGVVGAEFTDSRGNNVSAQEDADANNTGGFRPDGTASLNFDFPIDFAQAPVNYRSAAITNLFYWNNLLHDVHYKYGFTEAAGNFETLNYSGQGVGGDAVQADAQDGSGTNNANFATPPDGQAPRMQMYLFNYTSPGRDGDLDAEIITHEYGHGVSNRLTGGPANSNALDALQSGGMGEGWSDWWALMFTQDLTDTKLGSYPQGTYVLGQTSTGAGIRRYPYSYNMSINPQTIGNFNSSTEVHDAGELWCDTLWDMNWLLVDKYGYNSNIAAGYTGAGSAGNVLAMKLVMDALKLQPANPSFKDARDAILLADNALTGGANQYQIWSAFARRGMGYSFVDTSSSAASVTQAFDLPPGLLAPMVVSQSPTPSAVSTTPISSLGIIFSKAMNPASFDITADINSFTGPGGVDLKSQITGHSWTNSNATLHLIFSPQSLNGLYTLSLGPQILAGDDGKAMDQDADGTPGEAGQDAYSATFRYDALVGQVVSTNPTDGSLVQVPLTMVALNFNEAFDTASLTKTDLAINQGTVTGVTVIDADTARFTLNGVVAEGTLSLNLAAGAISDVNGNPMGAYAGSLALDAGTTPLPTPLTARGTSGSLIYDGGITATIGSNSDTDSFTLSLDPHQLLTVLVDPASGLRPALEVRDSGNNLIGSAASAAAGSDALLQCISIPAAGTYTITVLSVGGASSGAYALKATLNAALESEGYNGPTNDTQGTAQSLNNAFVSPVGASNGSIASVLGKTPASTGNVVLNEGFESGSLGPAWSSYHSDVDGRIQVSDIQSPAAGSYALFMDTTSASNIYNLNEAIWTVDLSGAITPTLTFSTISYSDEADVLATDFTGHVNGDGVAISSNGTNWRTIWTNSSPSSWTSVTVNLASAASAAGMTLGPNFKIKFQQYDNFAITTDGRGYDAIAITTPANASDFYSYSMTAGQKAAIGAKVLPGSAANLVLNLRDSSGNLLKQGTATAGNFDQVISTFTAPSDGTYYLLITADQAADYALSIVRDATFELEPNGASTPQPLSGLTTILGSINGEDSKAPANTGTIYTGARDLTGTSLSIGIAADGSFVGPTIGAKFNGTEYLRYGTYLAGFTAAFNGTNYTNDIAAAGSTAFTVTLEDISSGSMHGVRSKGTIGGLLGFQRTIWWNDGDPYAMVSTTLTNKGSSGLSGVALLDNQDPDPGGNYDTVNDVVNDGFGEFVVGSYSGLGGMGLGSIDSRAVASAEGFTITDPFEVINSPVDPNSASADIAINLAFNIGSLAVGQSTTTNFAMAFGSTAAAVQAAYDGISAKTASTVDTGDDRFSIALKAGDVLSLRTDTPGDGAGEFVNTLDPTIEIYNSSNVKLSSDDNGASDGRNALLTFIAPAAGTYTIRVLASTASKTLGEYVLSMSSNALRIDLPADVNESDGSASGTLSVSVAPSSDLVVTLASSNDSRITTPSSVVIPAGQSSVPLPLTVVGNLLLDGREAVTITASAGSYSAISAPITVHDDESATLNIVLPSSATEGVGTLIGTVTATAAPTRDVSVQLLSMSGRATVPASVILKAGQTSSNFNINVVDNGIIDGREILVVVANVENWTIAGASMAVNDNDHTLSITTSSSGWEGQTLNTGTVRIGGTLDFDLSLSLYSSDTTEVTVPAFVTIPKGQTTATFSLSLLGDGLKDGSQTVQISAESTAFATASSSVVVHDADLDHLAFDAITGPKTAAVAFSATARAFNIANEQIAVYNATASMTATGLAGSIPVTPASANFSNGVWTGNVAVNAVDAGVTLSANVGGVVGTSNVFAIQAGPIASLQWGTIGSPQVINAPFTATLTAKDAKGFTANFNGNVNLSGLVGSGTSSSIVISEAYTGTPDSIEFTNVSSSPVNIGGWQAYIYDIDYWPSPRPITFTFPLGTVVPAGGVFLLQESGTTPGTYPLFFTSENIDWTTSTPVAVLLRNATAQIVDFFAGYSAPPGSITSPTTIPTSQWQGSQVTTGANNYVRSGNLDHNNTTDWTAASTGNPGTLNSGLIIPFAGGSTPVNITPNVVTFANGIWTGPITALQAVSNMYLSADDGLGHVASSNTFNVIQPYVALTLPSNANEADGTINGTLNVTPVPGSDLIVTLVSSDPSRLTVPTTITVPAGQSSVTVPLSLLDNALLDGLGNVTISATVAGYTMATGTIIVHDNETAGLSVSLPVGATEGTGTVVGTISATAAPSKDIVVQLVSSNTGRATVPLTVTLPAGQTTANFSLNVVDNTVIDGTQLVTVTASVDNWTSGAGNISINDNDHNLTVTLPTTGWEGQSLSAAGTVRIGGTLASNLVVSLSSTDTSELTVPATVTILAGQTSATFTVTLLADGIKDGTQTAQITADAAGFSTATSSLIAVHDADLDHLAFDAITGPKTVTVAFSTTARALNVANEVISVYGSTSTLSATGQGGSLIVSPTTAAFSSGMWTSNVTVSSLDPAVILRLDAPGGAFAVSNTFAVKAGALSAFQWSSIDGQAPNVPFNVSLLAKDANGFTITDFAGTITLRGITGTSTSVLITPTTATFVNGGWTGSVTIQQVPTTMFLQADDGNGHVSNSNTFAVSTAVPAPSVPDLLSASDRGVSSTDNITNYNNSPATNAMQFLVAGTTVGATVGIYANGILVGSAVATATTTIVTTDGATKMNDGVVLFRARQTVGGIPSGDSPALSVTIDTVAPSVPAPPDLQAASDTGISTSDNITKDNSPTFSVVPPPYYRFYRNGISISSDYQSSTEFTPSAAQADGNYSYSIIALDVAGNGSGFSSALNVQIDTVALVLPAPDLQDASDTGISNSDNITSVIVPTFDLTSSFDAGIIHFEWDNLTFGTGPSITVATPGRYQFTPSFGPFSYQPQQLTTLGGTPVDTTSADVNGDGIDDLLVAVEDQHAIAILISNGNGTFKPVTYLAVPGAIPAPDTIRARDINSDGKIDLVVGTFNPNVLIYLGNGNGTFAAPTALAADGVVRRLNLGDVNGDGRVDIVANVEAKGLNIYLGTGPGTFGSSISIVAFAFAHDFQTGDFNKDGKDDLVVSDGNSLVSVALATGAGAFTSPVTIGTLNISYGVAVGDVNGDGNLDVVANGYFGNNVNLFMGNGNGTFKAGTVIATVAGAGEVLVKDLNGDRKLDIALDSDSTFDVTYLIGNGDGTFAAPVSSKVNGGGIYGLSAGDYNHDGFADLSVANFGGTNISVLYASGTSLGDKMHFFYDWIEDLAGNKSASSNSLAVVIDTEAPTVTGNPLTTSDSTPPLTGTINDGKALLKVAINGSNYTVPYTGGSNWTLPDDKISPLAPGTYPFTVTATDLAGNFSIASASLSVVLPPMPALQNVGIDDGTTQRSMVKSFTLNFNSAVILDPGAIELVKRGGSAVSLLISPSGSSAVFTVTFTGADVVGGSLSDGDYDLTVHANKIHDQFSRTPVGGDSLLSFHRLFGDSDGDRDVDSVDAAVFTSSQNSSSGSSNYRNYFDFDSDLDIDSLDALRFRQHQGQTI